MEKYQPDEHDKIRYNKLSEEEKQWLIRIMQKSELIKSAVSKHGKGKKRIDYGV